MDDPLIETASLAEVVQLAAVDSNFYAKTFFPKTARQDSPAFHAEMDIVLDNPANRFVSFEVFRGGAKTTKLRLFASKRIAYGISHTIVIVGKSQDHAIKSLHWMKRQVEYNRRWAQTFGLSRGDKWTDTEVEIIHGTDEYPIRIIALGITGSVRGINVDDYRPDLIIVDDVCDEENTATPEARAKIEDLLFGALAKSLAPASEAPNATMAIGQTPLHPLDIISLCRKDPQWASVTYSCFDTRGESRWPSRWSTEELLADKQAHINRNQLSLWLREMECTLVSQENAAFRLGWLKYYDIAPEQGLTYIGIDPTPPPKDSDTVAKRDNKKLDDAVVLVIRYVSGKVFLLEYAIAKSPDPEEFVNNIFRLVLTHRPMLVGIETTMFQRMLKWYIEKEMQTRRQFFTIIPVEDKRKKETRIVQTVTRYASNGQLWVHPEQRKFLDQYSTFQAGLVKQHDDILDALTIALDLINPGLEGVTYEGEYQQLYNDLPELEDWRSAP